MRKGQSVFLFETLRTSNPLLKLELDIMTHDTWYLNTAYKLQRQDCWLWLVQGTALTPYTYILHENHLRNVYSSFTASNNITVNKSLKTNGQVPQNSKFEHSLIWTGLSTIKHLCTIYLSPHPHILLPSFAVCNTRKPSITNVIIKSYDPSRWKLYLHTCFKKKSYCWALVTHKCWEE